MNLLCRYVLMLLAILFLTRAESALSADSENIENIKKMSISLGAEFTTGKYGTDTRTSSIYSPLIVTWLPTERLDLSVEFPILYQNSKSLTSNYYRTLQQDAAIAKTASRWGNTADGSGMQLDATASGMTASGGISSSSASGLGDIILRVGEILFFEDNTTPQVRPSLFVKFPTASKSNALGTGEFDAGAGVELVKWFGNLQLIGEGFYTYQGRAEGLGLKNYLSYTAGIGYQITNYLEPIFVMKGAEATSDYTGDLMEVRSKLLIPLTDATSIDLFLSHGISDSSPDYGGGIAVIYSF